MPHRRGLRAVLGRAFLRLNGWTVVGTLPPTRKYVLLSAPHTSNWDFAYLLAIGGVMGFDPHWIGKHSLFRGPMGPVMRALGGIAVDRRSRNNLVEQVVQAFQTADEFVLAIAPEGTRRKSTHWKTGFYYMAQGAGVPLQLGFLDYAKKCGGFGPVLTPSGDLQRDMATMRDYYAGVEGRFPQHASPVITRDQEPAPDADRLQQNR